MPQWLLLAHKESSFAFELKPQLRDNGKSYAYTEGKAEQLFVFDMEPFHKDDLSLSAKVSGKQAFDLLWNESTIKTAATVRFCTVPIKSRNSETIALGIIF